MPSAYSKGGTENRFSIEEKKIAFDPEIKFIYEMKELFPNRDVSYINKMRKESGLPPLYRVNVDHEYFETPNLENSYWAGFIAADGCITNCGDSKTKKLQIGLAAKDRSHLLKFSHAIGRNKINDIKPASGFNYSNIAIPSDKICKDLLLNFNITPRKTNNLQPPELSYENSLAYIAGLWDGDGTYQISQKRPSMSCVGNKDILNWAAEVLEIPGVNVHKHKSIFVIAYNGNRAIYARSRYIDMPLPFLERKYMRWEKLDVPKNLGLIKRSNSYLE